MTTPGSKTRDPRGVQFEIAGDRVLARVKAHSSRFIKMTVVAPAATAKRERPAAQQQLAEILRKGFDEQAFAPQRFAPAGDRHIVIIDGAGQNFVQSRQRSPGPQGNIGFQPLRHGAFLFRHANIRHQAQGVEVDTVAFDFRKVQAP